MLVFGFRWVGVLALVVLLCACGGSNSSEGDNSELLPTEPGVSPTPVPTLEPGASPTPLPAPTSTPTAIPIPLPSEQPTPVPSETPSPSPTPTLAPPVQPTPIPTASAEPTPEPSAPPSPTPEPSLQPMPSPEPTPQPTPGGDGESLYKLASGSSASCASCHAEDGSGVAGRGGEILNCGTNCNSLSALESKIALSMPIGNAAACDNDCAQAVARYIWTALMGKSLDGQLSCDVGIQKTSPMRRLNKTEIVNAVHDTFGIGSEHFATSLADETEVVGGFATVGTALTTSREWTERYLDAATSVAEDIVAVGEFGMDCSADSGASLPFPPGFSLDGDQCNTTSQCRSVFGQSANDCANSGASNSICMCGGAPCADATAVDNEACVKTALTQSGNALFRRPLSEAEVNRFIGLYTAANDHDSGLQHIIVALLTSPNFLFVLPDDERETIRKLSDRELAERLSLALWGSLPDKRLLELAASGSLYEVLDSEIDRMLDDPKFDRFGEGFVAPWLGLGGYLIEGSDLNVSDEDWALLLEDMRTESKLFVAHIIKNNLPVNELYTADYSFLNSRLAEHYGVESEAGESEFKLTYFPREAHRRGLMTHGSVLAKAYDGTKTSVVKRGVVPLEAFSCGAPEPPDDPEIENAVNDQAAADKTEKEKIAERADPAQPCAGCHAVIDPVGWVFTEFGVAGERVAQDPDGDPLNTGGVLYGEMFADAYEMAAVIADRGDFETCFATKFLIHSLGRRVDKHSREDNCAIENVVESVGGPVGARDFIKAMLQSDISTVSGTIFE